MAFIEVKGLMKEYVTKYRKISAVNDISFELEDGDFLAIKGKSGSGKTTLLHLLAGLIAPDKGEISIDNISLTRTKKKEIQRIRREHIGLVFQSFELLPYHNVLENIVMPLYINHKDVDMEEVATLLHEIGIYHLKDAFPNELSGGEQQRVAIARALIHKPKLLLMDEPTGNLDSVNTQIFLNTLIKIYKLKKQTIILVTHDEEVANIATKKMILKDGKIDFLDKIKNRLTY